MLLCAALLLGLFSGCSGGGGALRMDIDGPVGNLDPQFATDANARMLIANLYEGLVVQRADGSIEPGAAESWTVSEDGTHYTFTLREGVCWSDGEPLRAEDFVFAFRRLFQPESTSPYAGDFACLESAGEILAGRAAVSSLGVGAHDERTVVFRLNSPNALFLELLASTPAMPCSQELFESARGRYGLERQYVYSNGPFTLTRWDNASRITLTRSEHYVSDQPVTAEGVSFYIGRETAMSQFLDGKSDLIAITAAEREEVERKNAQVIPFDKTVWCIVFNQNRGAWGSALLRQGLARAVDDALLNPSLPDHLTRTDLFVPPDMPLLEQSYRDLVGDGMGLDFDAQQAAYLFALGLSTLELDRAPTATLVVPDTGAHAQAMGMVQQGWQKHLGYYINLELASASSIQSRLQSMDYQMMLIPFSPDSHRLGVLLGAMRSGSGQNYFGYHNERYDGALDAAGRQSDLDGVAAQYRAAEQMLLGDAVVIPVYTETTYYALGASVQGVEISPFAGQIHFKYASR